MQTFTLDIQNTKKGAEAFVKELPIFTSGNTKEELLANVHQAIDFYIKDYVDIKKYNLIINEKP